MIPRDDVLQMAKECGWIFDPHDKQDGFVWQLERFAALIEAEVTERCAKVCEARVGVGEFISGSYRDAVDGETRQCAAAIRARGA